MFKCEYFCVKVCVHIVRTGQNPLGSCQPFSILLLPLGSFLFSTCLCFAKVSPEFARPSLRRDLYIGKISIFDRICPGVCPHFRGTITIKAEISKMRGVDEKLCYAYAWFHFMTKFLLDFYKNWNNFAGKLWLYFFLLIYVKAMTLLAFIVLEENNMLLCLCQQRS